MFEALSKQLDAYELGELVKMKMGDWKKRAAEREREREESHHAVPPLTSASHRQCFVQVSFQGASVAAPSSPIQPDDLRRG